MRTLIAAAFVTTSLLFSASAQDSGIAKPNLVHRELVAGMPRGDRQEIRVISATFKPGDKTVFHTHRFPVTVYVLEGVFTLEMEGRASVVLKAGEAFVEPPNVKMTGHNRSTAETLKVVVFYVSDPDTPFLDPLH
jgi:quercetin dioxygenase-like cupin family protein